MTRDGNGLYAMRARHYDPQVGHFLQADPIGIAAGINLYSYAENDPILSADPSGLIIDPIDGPSLELLQDAALRSIDYFRNHRPLGPRNFANYRRIVQETFVRAARGDDYALRTLFQWAKGGHNPACQCLSRLGPRILNNPSFVGPRFASFAAQPSLLGRGVRLLGRFSGVAGSVYTAWETGWAVGTVVNEYLLPESVKERIGDFLLFVFDRDTWRSQFGQTSIVTSRDPNDILGPAGFGDQHWVRPENVLPYTIRFENASDAATAAQEVFLTNQLDPDMDLSTFELGSIGFGSMVVSVPPRVQEFKTSVEAMNEDGSPVFVHISVGLDLESAVASWTFRSLDPGTGQLPADVCAGFLPPNDETRRGEGFVSYFVRPLADSPTGTRIENSASIVFDVNDPILTEPVFNTIDAGAPSSSVDPLPAQVNSTTFSVSWSGSDDPGGAGIASYDIFVSEDDGPFAAFLQNTTLTSAEFAGQQDKQYAFYSVARDHVGHVESPPPTFDTQTTVTAGLPGDFNGDGLVNGDDFLTWQTGFGQFSGEATLSDGDANGDGLVNGDDFLIWQTNFGQSATAPAGAGAAMLGQDPTAGLQALAVAIAATDATTDAAILSLADRALANFETNDLRLPRPQGHSSHSAPRITRDTAPFRIEANREFARPRSTQEDRLHDREKISHRDSTRIVSHKLPGRAVDGVLAKWGLLESL